MEPPKTFALPSLAEIGTKIRGTRPVPLPKAPDPSEPPPLLPGETELQRLARWEPWALPGAQWAKPESFDRIKACVLAIDEAKRGSKLSATFHLPADEAIARREALSKQAREARAEIERLSTKAAAAVDRAEFAHEPQKPRPPQL